MKKVILLAVCCLFSAYSFANGKNVDRKHPSTARSSVEQSLNKPISSHIAKTESEKPSILTCTATSSVTCGDITVTYEVTADNCQDAGSQAGHLADLTSCG